MMHVNPSDRKLLIALAILIALPLFSIFFPTLSEITEPLKNIFIFSILGISLHILSGFTGLLSLGVAGFMALGSYSYAISTSAIYPFQLSFFGGLFVAIIIGSFAGLALGLPTLRLRGDYLAIVTLGFGEIVQDILRNLDGITKGTQGINPLPSPDFFGLSVSSSEPMRWYYLLLAITAVIFFIAKQIEVSRLGRSLKAIRDDELAASSLGFTPFKIKTISFMLSAALAAIAGALWASFLGSSGEPGNFDFNVSALALCIVIVGGLGDLFGVLIGALIMVGLNSIVLVKIASLLQGANGTLSSSVFASPNNYKYMIFGLALVIVMQFKYRKSAT
jgi:branched-chain amino acid transport system permease protein